MENISSLFFFSTVVLGLFPLKDVIHLNDVIASDNASTYFRGQHTLQKKEQLMNWWQIDIIVYALKLTKVDTTKSTVQKSFTTIKKFWFISPFSLFHL